MAREPAERHASVGDLARDLHGFLEARVMAVRGRGFWSAVKQGLLRRQSRVGRERGP